MNKNTIHNWQKTILDVDKTINDAIKNLINTSLQIVLIVSKDKKLVGTITDGDIRRAMLKGYTLKDKVSKVMKNFQNRHFVSSSHFGSRFKPGH